MTETEPKTRLSRANASWLDAQSAAWVSTGLIDGNSRARILDSYEIESTERRSLLALMLLGALMFGIGVLLLIGYNWARLPVNGKIAIILTSVALAFGGAAAAFARQRRMAGETLAFVGVLLYGNAIWLIAQVLHIRGNYADAFMWWAIGALACAWLVRSHIVGVGAALLVLIWIAVAAGQTFDRPGLMFVAVWVATLALAYGQTSRLALALAAVAAIVWACWVPDRIQPGFVSIGAAALMGCAFFAIGAWHRAPSPMARAWQTTGLAALAIVLVPLLINDFHRVGRDPGITWRSLIVVLPSLLVTASLAARSMQSSRADAPSRHAPAADIAVMVAGAVLAVWLGLLAAGYANESGWAYLTTFAFSLLALGLSVSFIHKALGSDTASDLVFGVLFALVFLLVRWASLIDSMLWSGVMLLVASSGFFAIARLWNGRQRRQFGVSPAVTGEAR